MYLKAFPEDPPAGSSNSSNQFLFNRSRIQKRKKERDLS
jgi:hypothetical protein